MTSCKGFYARLILLGACICLRSIQASAGEVENALAFSVGGIQVDSTKDELFAKVPNLELGPRNPLFSDSKVYQVRFSTELYRGLIARYVVVNGKVSQISVVYPVEQTNGANAEALSRHLETYFGHEYWAAGYKSGQKVFAWTFFPIERKIVLLTNEGGGAILTISAAPMPSPLKTGPYGFDSLEGEHRLVK